MLKFMNYQVLVETSTELPNRLHLPAETTSYCCKLWHQLTPYVNIQIMTDLCDTCQHFRNGSQSCWYLAPSQVLKRAGVSIIFPACWEGTSRYFRFMTTK